MDTGGDQSLGRYDSLLFAALVGQLLQEKTNNLAAPMELSLVPRTALLSLMILMFLALSNTGGGAFIYFQF